MQRLLGLILAIVTFTPAVGAAQELIPPRPRQGYFIGGGLRPNVLIGDTRDVGSLGTLTGMGGAFRFGQMANEWIGFGLVLGGGGGSNDEWTGGFGGLGLEVQLVPSPELDLAIRAAVGPGGIGISRVDESRETEDDPSGTFGAVYTLGVSYDVFPWYETGSYDSGGFAVTGFLEATLIPGDGITVGGAVIGIELTWWSGFQKNRLDLPVDAAF